MATTLQNILSGIRGANLLDRSKVGAGYKPGPNGNDPPYIAVVGYEHGIEYDTGGPALKEATFKVLVIHRDCDDAEALADQVNGVLDRNTALTPTCIGVFQEGYTSSQMAENLNQWGVEITYKLTENLPG